MDPTDDSYRFHNAIRRRYRRYRRRIYESLAGRSFWGRRMGVPSYWESKETDLKNPSLTRLRFNASSSSTKNSSVADLFPVNFEHRPIIQDLMHETIRGPLETGCRLVRACRIENPVLWEQYKEGVQHIAERHGFLHFHGQPPATQAVRDIGDTARILSTLDGGTCEAYLWFGTDPASAQDIAHQGFQGKEPCGEGQGSCLCVRFAEDFALADIRSKPGEGLYQDCFAMLLCRVVLGKQQTQDSPNECLDDCATVPGDSEWWDRSRYDSAIEETNGCPREFIPFKTTQVYPEYMLVYERCQLGDLVARGAEQSRWSEFSKFCKPVLNVENRFERSDSGGLYRSFSGEHIDRSPREDRRVAVPAYWHSFNYNGERPFRELMPVTHFKPAMQRLMRETWRNKYTRDRKGLDGLRLPRGDPHGDMPTGVRLLKVLRVEDSGLWHRYATALAEISERRHRCTPLPGHPVYTNAVLGPKGQGRLSHSVNEVFLWHGSSPQAVTSIVQSGFNLDLSGSATGAMFGRGTYFAECSSKADEYSSDDKDGYYQGCFAMLLCRVVLGEVQTLTEADCSAHLRTGPDQPYDSTLGDREAARGTYREFVVPSQAQIYPEYAIIYERLYRSNRIR